MLEDQLGLNTETKANGHEIKSVPLKWRERIGRNEHYHHAIGLVVTDITCIVFKTSPVISRSADTDEHTYSYTHSTDLSTKI